MKFSEFKIKNFKGIDDITFNLEKSPEANIFTLVGLNESGKTTILEAINLFNANNKGMNALDLPGSYVKDYNLLIPISKRDNFNGKIEINVKIKIEEDDLEKINTLVSNETPFKKVRSADYLHYFQHYKFEDSKFLEKDSRWSGFYGWLDDGSDENYINIEETNYSEENLKLATFCRKLIPSILYFPNFLFDFPSKILLESNIDISPKDNFYLELVQDILYSLKNETNVKTHLVDRIKSTEKSQKRSLDRLVQLMELKVTDIIFEAWNRIFKRKIKDTRVSINYDLDSDGKVFLEFQIEAVDGIYQINERSLGFRWFFIFLLFTQFRPFRKDTPKNMIFLFDEPASNLHSSAQKQLLKSFENLIENSKVIYTTHSHHLINSHWLESTYVVKNEGLNLEENEDYNIKKTNISIQPYREFVSKHPHNTAYFQPILDVLDYTPSNLEMLSNCIFLEGKNDFYTISYFKDTILKLGYKLNLSPSTSASNLDTLISLYIGWGKEFIILLDSDEEGIIQRNRYIERYGILAEKAIFTIEDINPEWKNVGSEKLFSEEEKLSFQQIFYPDTIKFNKTHFNRAIQEALMNKIDFEFSTETQDKYLTILNFLNSKINFNI